MLNTGQRFKLVVLSTAVVAAGVLAWRLISPASFSNIVGMKEKLECSADASRFTHARTVRIYDVDYQSDTTADLSRLFKQNKDAKSDSSHNKVEPAPSSNRAQLSVRANWEITTLEQSGRLIFMGRLLNPQITLEHNGQSKAALNEQLIAELQKPFLAELSPQGEVLELKSQKGLGKIEKNILRALVAESQVVLPLKTAGQQSFEQWTTRERDANGYFESRYQASSAHSPNDKISVSKTKERYLDLAGPTKRQHRGVKPLDVKPELEPALKETIELDCQKSALSSIAAEGSVKTRINRTEISASHFRLRMNLVKLEPLADNADLGKLLATNGLGSSGGPIESYTVTSVESAEEMEALIQKNELGDLTTDKLLQLLKLAKASGNAEAVENLYLKFKALIYLHPEACPQLAAQMKQEDPQKSKAMLMLATALSTVGSPQAQDALIDVLHAKASDVASSEVLIPALGMTGNPTQKSEDTLRELIRSSEREEIVSTAGLSLGAMAGHLADQNPERSRAIVESVQGDFQRADNDTQKAYLLSVLGNAGSNDSLPLLSTALSSTNPQIQAEAAMALRFVPDREAQAKLVDIIAAGNIDSSVKEAAASALSYREPTLALSQTMQANFGSQASDQVRRELIKAVYENRHVDPGVGDWLKSVASRDQSPEVRKLANDYAGMLSSGDGSL